MEEQNIQNQTYTIEEKTGKIIKVEEMQEKHRKQKLALKVATSVLCTTIIASGIIAFSRRNENITETKQTIVTEAQLNDPNAIVYNHAGEVVTAEEAMKEARQENQLATGIIDESCLFIYQEENKINDEWVKGSIFTLPLNQLPPANTANTQFVFLGQSESTNVVLYQKEVRMVSTDEFGNVVVNSDWIKTDQYIMNDGTDIPVNTIDTRYIPIYSNLERQAVAVDNAENVIDDTISSGRSR